MGELTTSLPWRANVCYHLPARASHKCKLVFSNESRCMHEWAHVNIAACNLKYMCSGGLIRYPLGELIRTLGQRPLFQPLRRNRWSGGNRHDRKQDEVPVFLRRSDGQQEKR